MRIFPLVVLSLIAIPAQATDLLTALDQFQASLPSAPTVTTERPPTGITTPTAQNSDVDTNCTEDKQTSLPLKHLTKLIYQRDAKLDINHDASSGILRISSPAKMIGNCNSMLQWNLKNHEIDGQKTYSVEVKFKDGETCPAEITDAGDKKCYRVAKMKDGAFDKFEVKPFSNDYRGFQACLADAGVIKADGSVDVNAVYKQNITESFSGIQETGKLVFLSHGPNIAGGDTQFGLERQNQCDVYEKIHPDLSMLYSASDQEANRLAEEANRLKDCPVNDYWKVADFLERYDQFSAELGDVRDRLIKEAAERVAKLIIDGKELSEEDRKVILDFEKYIVEPKRQEIAQIFASLENLQGPDLERARTLLNTKRNELAALGIAPFFQEVHVEKLLVNGKFEDVENMEGLRITISEASKIGKTENGVLITPDEATIRIANSKGDLKDKIVVARENFEIRTGVITGMSQSYSNLSVAMRNNINRRTQNYTQEIQSEYARIQQGGYCYRYFRNTQKCIQDSLQRIQELQAALAHYNQIDHERAAEYDQKASEYAALESQGRAHVARMNGEEPPREPAQSTDTTVVPQRTEDPNEQAQAQPGMQNMMPPWMMNQTQPYQNPMMMQQQNPYANMYGQNNMMGQAGFNAQFGFQGSMGQNYMGMPQQYGNVGVNWFAMGQQQGFGQQQFAPQSFWGGNQMGSPMGFNQSPYGQMYGQAPYMQQNAFQQPWMQQAHSFPNYYR